MYYIFRNYPLCSGVSRFLISRIPSNRFHRYMNNASKSTVNQTEALIVKQNKTVRQFYKKKTELGPIAWFLLVIPVSAFGLGTWQVQRKRWKENLIKSLRDRTSKEPVSFPEDISEISAMEYNPIRVTGTFDHTREILIGPRSLIKDGDSTSNSGSIISNVQTGFHVITPFKLSDRDLIILINRGWIPQAQKDPKKRMENPMTEEVELVGVVRHSEERLPLMPKNDPQSNLWYYRDLNKMSELTGASPIFLDAVVSTSVPEGPIGGQTRVTLRNEHLSYILTWYGLSIATGVMWYRHFIRKLPL